MGLYYKSGHHVTRSGFVLKLFRRPAATSASAFSGTKFSFPSKLVLSEFEVVLID